MKILIYYPYFTDSIGGGEFIPLTIIRELQAAHEIVLLTRTGINFESVQHQYGVRLDDNKVKVCSLLPKRKFDRWLNVLFRHYASVTIRKWAKVSDLCISCHDVIDFGRPGVHFMCMSNFDYEFQKWLTGIPLPKRKFLHRIFRFVFDLLKNVCIVRSRTPREIFKDPRERIFPNSNYIARAVATYYGRNNLEVFYPPTLFEPVKCNVGKNGVVYIGRIDAAKHIDSIIEIVEQVRLLTHEDLALAVAGLIFDDDYGNEIRRMAETRPWITLLGAVSGERKQKLLASAEYAIHACTIENFGISVTEYLKAGIIPIVPKLGGAYEIVDCHALSYETQEEAVSILVELIKNPRMKDDMRKYCLQRGLKFSAASYWAAQKDLLSRLINVV